jgi:CRP-like cAMP-binding protein
MKTFEQVLAEHPFFEGLAEKYFFMLAEHATFVTYETDQFIFHQGDEADRFYLINEGKIALEVVTLSHGSMVIQTLGPNEVLGWSWLFPPYRWHFDARASEPTKAVALDAAWLRQKCKEEPELGHEVMERIARLLVQRLQATRLQLLDIYGIHF